MKQSLTYYITLFIIKLKGLKNDFSKYPIDFKKIRKEDVRYPKEAFFTRNKIRNFKVLNSSITEIGLNRNSDKLLIFIHGGAFISGPAKHHWDTVKEIVKKSNCLIWMCDYPKAPENKINKISENIDAMYSSALESYPSNCISILGDSVGGTLATALIQRLIFKNRALPSMLILVTPVMDASMSNPKIKAFEKLDPMLSKIGVLSAKKMCAGNKDLKDKIISPLNGNFEGFPRTILFIAQNDIMYPDGKLAGIKMRNSNVNIQIIEGINMPHIWPFLPIMKEANTALKKIVQFIKTNQIKI